MNLNFKIVVFISIVYNDLECNNRRFRKINVCQLSLLNLRIHRFHHKSVLSDGFLTFFNKSNTLMLSNRSPVDLVSLV